jgi:phenylacetate-CoA ligase
VSLPDVPFPARSPADIVAIQAARLPIAFERARGSAFYKGRLDGIDARKLDDPEVWRKIPVLTKDELRRIAPDAFHDTFCIGQRRDIVEYWRSGGATGRPLFYPRSAEDLRYGIEGFRRLLLSPGLTPDDMMHVSFPLGIHPVGHLYARAAEDLGIGTVWCGAGTNTPSEVQIELIRTLKPTVWAGMASYGLQLAQVAERVGFDLAGSSVKKFLTAAEPISPGKRARIERLWGAELYDQFGCTEGSAMASESAAHDGMHFWTDLFHVEVVEEATGKSVGVGESGRLVMTPLWNNTLTPFLRWDTGDYVTFKGYAATGPLAAYPLIAHAARTAGFFKVRGININQAEIEDLMHRTPAVADFKIEAIETATLDGLRISVELARGAEPEAARRELGAAIKRTFELTPEIVFLATGTVEKELAGQVKPNRFVDRRGGG